ncbi:MAG: tagaturonate reductase [Clostridia bacterium]|nr:tagaturonate reductase [Clostridia bacterium]
MTLITQTKPTRPTKVIQFGGGVFLRGFFDWMLQKANDAGVFCGNTVIVRSRTAGIDPLAAQNFNYTHLSRDGKHSDITLIDCIAGSVNAAQSYEEFLALAENPDTDVIVSNTTESGIEYTPCPRPDSVCPESFPAKLTALLYRRYTCGLGGMLIIPCELIVDNGDVLCDIVLRHAADWALEKDFIRFVRDDCSFRNTLVDRIVSGTPSDPVALGYRDDCLNASEYFHLFVIEGEEDPRLPLRQAGINLLWVPSASDYRTIKVRILNAAHTSMVPLALLCGVETVGECLKNDPIRTHLSGCLSEIVDSLDLDRSVTTAYAKDVLERFANPYIHHKCQAIALNSISKFRVRILPSILAYEKKFGRTPPHLMRAWGKLIAFYKHGTPNDDPVIIAKLRDASVREILADVTLWEQDVSRFTDEVEHDADPSKG